MRVRLLQLQRVGGARGEVRRHTTNNGIPVQPVRRAGTRGRGGDQTVRQGTRVPTERLPDGQGERQRPEGERGLGVPQGERETQADWINRVELSQVFGRRQRGTREALRVEFRHEGDLRGHPGAPRVEGRRRGRRECRRRGRCRRDTNGEQRGGTKGTSR